MDGHKSTVEETNGSLVGKWWPLGVKHTEDVDVMPEEMLKLVEALPFLCPSVQKLVSEAESLSLQSFCETSAQTRGTGCSGHRGQP